MGVNIIEITQKNYLNTLIKSGIHVHTTKVQPNSNIGFHTYTCLPYEYHFCQPPSRNQVVQRLHLCSHCVPNFSVHSLVHLFVRLLYIYFFINKFHYSISIQLCL